MTEDGTIYGTQTGTQDESTWKLYKITPGVVNIGNNEVLTFSPEGKLLATELAIDGGNDGLAMLPDGTKYVGSVR